MRSPRFRTKDVATCMGSSTAQGPPHTRQSARDDIVFWPAARHRHLGIRPVSQLHTQPMASPVNASRLPSRTAAHHSGPKPLAKRYSVKDLHLLSFASLSWHSLLRVKICFKLYVLRVSSTSESGPKSEEKSRGLPLNKISNRVNCRHHRVTETPRNRPRAFRRKRASSGRGTLTINPRQPATPQLRISLPISMSDSCASAHHAVRIDGRRVLGTTCKTATLVDSTIAHLVIVVLRLRYIGKC